MLLVGKRDMQASVQLKEIRRWRRRRRRRDTLDAGIIVIIKNAIGVFACTVIAYTSLKTIEVYIIYKRLRIQYVYMLGGFYFYAHLMTEQLSRWVSMTTTWRRPKGFFVCPLNLVHVPRRFTIPPDGTPPPADRRNETPFSFMFSLKRYEITIYYRYMYTTI